MGAAVKADMPRSVCSTVQITCACCVTWEATQSDMLSDWALTHTLTLVAEIAPALPPIRSQSALHFASTPLQLAGPAFSYGEQNVIYRHHFHGYKSKIKKRCMHTELHCTHAGACSLGSMTEGEPSCDLCDRNCTKATDRFLSIPGWQTDPACWQWDTFSCFMCHNI